MNTVDQSSLVLFYFIGAVIIIGLFFVLREVFMWYYKINLRLNEQKRTNFLLEKLLTHYGVPISESEPTTLRVRIKKTGEVIVVSQNAWEKMKKEYGEDTYEILQ